MPTCTSSAFRILYAWPHISQTYGLRELWDAMCDFSSEIVLHFLPHWSHSCIAGIVYLSLVRFPLFRIRFVLSFLSPSSLFSSVEPSPPVAFSSLGVLLLGLRPLFSLLIAGGWYSGSAEERNVDNKWTFKLKKKKYYQKMFSLPRKKALAFILKMQVAAKVHWSTLDTSTFQGHNCKFVQFQPKKLHAVENWDFKTLIT